MVSGAGMRYITDTPKWYAVMHPVLGIIIVVCMDISTSCEVIVRDTEAELREALGAAWPEQL